MYYLALVGSPLIVAMFIRKQFKLSLLKTLIAYFIGLYLSFEIMTNYEEQDKKENLKYGLLKYSIFLSILFIFHYILIVCKKCRS